MVASYSSQALGTATFRQPLRSNAGFCQPSVVPTSSGSCWNSQPGASVSERGSGPARAAGPRQRENARTTRALRVIIPAAGPRDPSAHSPGGSMHLRFRILLSATTLAFVILSPHYAVAGTPANCIAPARAAALVAWKPRPWTPASGWQWSNGLWISIDPVDGARGMPSTEPLEQLGIR